MIGAIDLMFAGVPNEPSSGTPWGRWARGHGYATRAVRLLSGGVHTHTEARRLELPIPLENARSRAVAERSGFTREGTLRSYLWLREGGDRHDVAMYARLPADAPPA